MSGYTKHTAPAAELGQQPEVLLLDRSHFEAMLFGLITPDELLERLTTHVTRRGGVYVPLEDLLVANAPAPPPAFTVASGDAEPKPLIRDTAGGIEPRGVLLGRPGWSSPTGLGTGSGTSDVLITTHDGIIRVDPQKGATAWALPPVRLPRDTSSCH